MRFKMKKSLAALGLATLVSVSAAFADVGMFDGALPENWTADVVAAAKFTRLDFSNWQEDGTSSYTWLFTYDADLKAHWENIDWRNKVNLALGQTWTDGLGKRKAADKIFIETMADFNVTEKFKPYVGARFETQFAKGYEYSEDENGDEVKTAVSSFMDPAYVTQMAGVAFIPNDNFSQRLGFANRMTISDGYGFADDHGAEKIARGDRAHLKGFKDEPGLESITEFKYAFSDILNFKSRLWAFVNFEGLDEIDGKWENLFTISLAPLFEVQLGFDMAYDKDQDEDAQYKNMILVGVSWRWF